MNFLGGEKVPGKKQPIELVMAKGKKHLTKSEIEQRKAEEVKAPADKIEPPSYLPDNLRKEFNRIADQLIEIEIMSNLDVESLARFVVAEYQYQQVTVKLLNLKGMGQKYIDLMYLQEKLFKMCRAAASDLGLSISSRCKLVVPKKNDEQPPSKFSKFVGGKNG
jgi:P27 family predicted phage terminase small subunit